MLVVEEEEEALQVESITRTRIGTGALQLAMRGMQSVARRCSR